MELIEALGDWNPWWERRDLIGELEGVHRSAYEDLIASVDVREVTVLTGARRSGKSTLMYQMIGDLLNRGARPEQILFVNLEDKALAGIGLDEMYTAYREAINPDDNAYIFLDEVHRREGWEAWIRKRYDRRTKDKFVISGSSSSLLKREYATLLTGRNLTFEVFLLSYLEFLDFGNERPDVGKGGRGPIGEETRHRLLNRLERYMERGGFPEVYFKPERFKMRLLAQYFDDILYKDIVERHDLSSRKVRDLALFLMTNIAGTISLRSLRGSMGLSYDTIKKYLSCFEEARLFFILDHFSYSFKEQKTLPSKVYCIDNGLRNAVSFRFSGDKGKLAENLVLVELRRRDKDVYYWKGKGEVDFIIKNRDRTLSALNVTYTDTVSEREVNALMEFSERFERTRDMIILTRNLERKEGGISFVPLWIWLLSGDG
ncbi:MAG: ATP-binding protein [Candidatus Undinarchaeales archaeon]|nr:ATP-binding protein [Candidatus Undinarchaeales archaeon]MDP7493695.1 ATP-binding protein [Candidatus Undinarchaeales archaeon]